MDRKIIFVFSLFLALSLTIGEVQAQIISTPKKAKATVSAKNKNTAKTSSTATLKLNGNEDDFSISIEQCGGLVEMNVITNASIYTIDQMPSFCKLQSQMGSTFVIKCEPNNTNQDRRDILIVSVPEGKKIEVSLQQGKKTEVSLQQKGNETSFLHTLYGITLGKTTFKDMLARGFQRKYNFITADKWKGTYSVGCFKSNLDTSETIISILVQWMYDTLPFPQEWREAGAPSGNSNYYLWKDFLQQNGFIVSEEVKKSSVSIYSEQKILTAVNKNIGLEISVESATYDHYKDPNPSLPSSRTRIGYIRLRRL